MKPFKATTKPVTIEAILWTGDNFVDVDEFAGGACGICEKRGLIVTSMSGDEVVEVGEYIIKGAYGYCYPCSPDKFKKTYNF